MAVSSPAAGGARGTPPGTARLRKWPCHHLPSHPGASVPTRPGPSPPIPVSVSMSVKRCQAGGSRGGGTAGPEAPGCLGLWRTRRGRTGGVRGNLTPTRRRPPAIDGSGQMASGAAADGGSFRRPSCEQAAAEGGEGTEGQGSADRGRQRTQGSDGRLPMV